VPHPRDIKLEETYLKMYEQEPDVGHDNWFWDAKTGRPPILHREHGGFTAARIPKKEMRFAILGVDNNYYHMGKIIAALQWAWARELPGDPQPKHICLPGWFIDMLNAVEHGDLIYGMKILKSEEYPDDIYLTHVES
jgi:hypothetical protein